MRELTGITNQPKQTFQVPLDDGTRITFTLYYKPAVQMWFFDWSRLGKSSNGNRLCRSVNILWQHRNNIPFGLLVQVNNDTDPFLIDDFTQGRVQLFLLSESEVQDVYDAVHP